MSWSRDHSSLTENSTTSVVERCINFGDHEEVQATITLSLQRAITTQDLFVGGVIQAAKAQGSLNSN